MKPKTLEQLKQEFIIQWGQRVDDDGSMVDDMEVINSDLNALLDKAREEAQDELIEWIVAESNKTNGISTDRGIVTFLTETAGGYDISEIQLIDWLKSLK